MEMAKDYYKILGVPKSAATREIKAAYRKLARKYHPDVNPGDSSSEQRFKEISEAYQVLSDSEKRKRYDQFGTIDPSAFTGSGAGPGGFGFSGFDFGGFDVGSASGSFGDIFNEIFGRRKKRRAAAAARRGQDTQYTMSLSFHDALKGVETEVLVGRREQCGTCKGSGRVLTGGTKSCPACGGKGRRVMMQGAMRFEATCEACGGSGILSGEPCRICRGEGTVPKQERIKVRIPAGMDNGSRVRVPGKGDAGTGGGPPGDLYIVISVQPHKFFTRKGNNIYVTIPITVSEAALGTKLEVPTIDGTATIRIPPATQGGQRFRLRGRGVRALRGGGSGDQFVEVKIVLPEIIDEGAKSLYRKLKEAERWNPRTKLYSDL
jgi:molecular chaperone DnaJ